MCSGQNKNHIYIRILVFQFLSVEFRYERKKQTHAPPPWTFPRRILIRIRNASRGFCSFSSDLDGRRGRDECAVMYIVDGFASYSGVASCPKLSNLNVVVWRGRRRWLEYLNRNIRIDKTEEPVGRCVPNETLRRWLKGREPGDPTFERFCAPSGFRFRKATTGPRSEHTFLRLPETSRSKRHAQQPRRTRVYYNWATLIVVVSSSNTSSSSSSERFPVESFRRGAATHQRRSPPQSVFAACPSSRAWGGGK